jgi:hypothetical protein
MPGGVCHISRPEMRKLAGTPISELVDQDKLKSADILLEHSRRSIWGWLIRLGTGNYWNHALMVCSIPGEGNKCDKTLIIDPRMGGIRTIDLHEYFERYKDCDVSVKRFEADWFQDTGRTGESRFHRVVSDYALRRIDDRSTMARPLGSVRRTLRRLSIIYRFIRRKRKLPKRRKTLNAKPINLNTYACSGIVQWSYYRGVDRMITEEGLAADLLQEVIFSPTLVGQFSDADLLSITPADLARCDKLSWKYVVRDGVVWEVSSEGDIRSIIN